MSKNGVFSRIRKLDNVEGGDNLMYGNSNEVHVLAVDDSLVDRKVIERLLKITACKVTAVDSGIRALQFLGLDTEESPVGFHVDLIITDYCMPGMTGYELLKKIKGSSNFRAIPVVIMSSENILARIDRCLEEGAEDFIVKPVKLSDLKRLKRCMFGEGSRVTEGRDGLLFNKTELQDSASAPLSESPSSEDFSSTQSPPSVSSPCSPRSSSSSSSPSQPSSPTSNDDTQNV